jgi:hypothetical protein
LLEVQRPANDLSEAGGRRAAGERGEPIAQDQDPTECGRRADTSLGGSE